MYILNLNFHPLGVARSLCSLGNYLLPSFYPVAYYEPELSGTCFLATWKLYFLPPFKTTHRQPNKKVTQCTPSVSQWGRKAGKWKCEVTMPRSDGYNNQTVALWLSNGRTWRWTSYTTKCFEHHGDKINPHIPTCRQVRSELSLHTSVENCTAFATAKGSIQSSCSHTTQDIGRSCQGVWYHVWSRAADSSSTKQYLIALW